jgi:asparagine synthase (glutamine-hydrolysing)
VCGIAGYTGHEIAGLGERMIDLIRPRGPDAVGRSHRPPVHLFHTRLSIVDLSDHGAQPMERVSHRLAVSFNGEIYNYQELRDDIEKSGYRFEGHSDTELLPLGFAAFGADFFRRLNGMFAFALHDARDDSLYLARDHFGIKPLYYAQVPGGDIVFSSSARAVSLHPEVDSGLDTHAIRDFLQQRYVPSGQSFYRGVKTLPPGTMARWHRGTLSVETFWRPERRHPRSGVALEAWVEGLRELLGDSVRLQLRSDVPMGVFLSGGVDSEAVMHYAARHSAQAPLAFTFAIGDDHDESQAAAIIAARYGAEHRVVEIASGRPFDHLYDAVACMDAPVGDAIIVPTFLLCEAAARDRKVVLTGEGADELFGGYVHVPVLRKLSRLTPVAPLVRALAPLLRLVPPMFLDPFFDYQAELGRQGRDKVAALLGVTGQAGSALRAATSIFSDDDLLNGTLLEPAPSSEADLSLGGLLQHGFETWLPNQILNKMDQLSMAHGLEARVPFLDRRIYEFLLDVPDALLLDGKRNKVLLRELIAREGIGDPQRRKHAFHLPVERQYTSDLEQLAKCWLSDGQVKRHGIIRSCLVQSRLEHLRRGDFLASKQLVAMICLHMWLDARTGSVALAA